MAALAWEAALVLDPERLPSVPLLPELELAETVTTTTWAESEVEAAVEELLTDLVRLAVDEAEEAELLDDDFDAEEAEAA